MSRTPVVAGNWKMHGSRAANASLVSGVLAGIAPRAERRAEVVMCPPFVYLAELATSLEQAGVGLGAQDVCAEAGQGTTPGLSTCAPQQPAALDRPRSVVVAPPPPLQAAHPTLCPRWRGTPHIRPAPRSVVHSTPGRAWLGQTLLPAVDQRPTAGAHSCTLGQTRLAPRARPPGHRAQPIRHVETRPVARAATLPAPDCH